MNDEQRKRLREHEGFRELEETIANQDKQMEESERRRAARLAKIVGLDGKMEQAADVLLAVIADSIRPLAEQLAKLDLISKENPGTPIVEADVPTIEVQSPEPRLYALQDVDTIVATRMRTDGRYEHAVLDEHGMPIEWRLAIRPNLN